MIRSSDRLLGFTEREVELVALVARYQRKALPRTGHAEFAALNVADRARVQLLAGILRIAIALDRTRSGAVSGLTAEVGEALVITCRTSPGVDATVELYTANQRSELLAAATGLAVRVSAESPVPAGAASEG